MVLLVEIIANMQQLSLGSQSSYPGGATGITEVNHGVFAVIALWLLGIFLFGSAGNYAVIHIMLRVPQLRTPMNLLICNLAVADFIIVILGTPASFIAAVFSGWPETRFMCRFYGFAMALGGMLSIGTLTILAFQRFVRVVQPEWIRLDYTYVDQRFVIITIWMYALVLTMPPLFGWNEYTIEGIGVSCSVAWGHMDVASQTYVMFLFTFGFIFPVFVIMFSYISLCLAVKMTAASSSTTRVSSCAEKRITMMVTMMILAFLTAWSPYAFVALFTSLGVKFGPILSSVPALFAKSSTCYNPIIYAYFNPQFRAEWKRIWYVNEDRNETEMVQGPSFNPVKSEGEPGETATTSFESKSNKSRTTQVRFSETTM